MKDEKAVQTANSDSGKTAIATKALTDQLAGDANLGLEDTSYEDLLIPRLKIVQKQSPELEPNSNAYLPDAKVGYIVDSTYGVVYGNQILYIPVIYRREYIEWKPREQGGGLSGIHGNREILNNATRRDGRLTLPNGNTISPTMNFFGFIHAEGEFRLSAISMSSTQLKKGKKLVTLANQERMRDSKGMQFTPPMFARAYILGTALEQNAKGSWYGFTINRGIGIDDYEQLDGFEMEAFLTSARNTANAVQSDSFRIDPEPEGAKQDAADSDDIPL